MSNKKTCGTCRFWSFKSSDEKNSYGKCLNEKVTAREGAIYAHLNPPECITEGKSTEKIVNMMNNIIESIEFRFDEYRFGCICHEAMD